MRRQGSAVPVPLMGPAMDTGTVNFTFTFTFAFKGSRPCCVPLFFKSSCGLGRVRNPPAPAFGSDGVALVYNAAALGKPGGFVRGGGRDPSGERFPSAYPTCERSGNTR